ncbi:hypothetical protein P9112_008180 [Eukaryota sp. TZLM1-RC]
MNSDQPICTPPLSPNNCHNFPAQIFSPPKSPRTFPVTSNTRTSSRRSPSSLSPHQMAVRRQFLSKIGKARANLVAQRRNLTFDNLCLEPGMQDCLFYVSQMSSDEAIDFLLELEDKWNDFISDDQLKLQSVEDDLDPEEFF